MSKESAMAALTGTPAPTSPSPAPLASPAVSEQLQSTPFSHLAKKEAELVRQKQDLRRERESFLTEQKKVQEIQTKVKEYEDLKIKDPVAALKHIGFSETDILNYLAAENKPELTSEQKAEQIANQAAEAKLKEWEDRQLAKQQEALKESDNRLIQGFKSDLSKTIEANKDMFEYCSYYGKEAEDLAYETTLAVLSDSKGKEVLSPKEAIQLVEEFFEERDKEMNSLKKRQAKAEVPAEASPSPERSRTVTPGHPNAEQPKPTITKSRTLSNTATATVASTRLRMNESKGDKRERLMQALRDGIKP